MHDYGIANGGVMNEVDYLAAHGLFDTAPTAGIARPALVDPFGAADVSTRVRSYWDGNCAHCHSMGGFASQSGLWLDFPSTDPATTTPESWGICKHPTADPFPCGDNYDVVPGSPDTSIMVCRVGTTNSKYKMPLLGGNLVDQNGLTLIRDWIGSLPTNTCM